MKVLRPEFIGPMLPDEDERWATIPGFEGTHEVSSWGRVRSLDRYVRTISRSGTESLRFSKGRIVTQSKCNSQGVTVNRWRLSLQKWGVPHNWLSHRLVMHAFVGPCPEGMQVAHNDGNAANNHLSNLRYATAWENAQDKLQHGVMARGESHGHSKITEDDALYIRSQYGKKPLKVLSEMFGIGESAISSIQRGCSWRHLNERVEAGPA